MAFIPPLLLFMSLIYMIKKLFLESATGWIARFSGRMAALQLHEKAME